MASSDFHISDPLITKVTDYVKAFMSNYDASHDFNHIQRVVNLAHRIQASIPTTSRDIVTLSALLHDVGDKKYLKPGEDSSLLIYSVLISLGATNSLAEKIQTICLGVSYSSEIQDPAQVMDLIKQHPELAIVQDADRLDALGAVGIGRTFAFGATKNRDLVDTINHFDEKLLKLENIMKTDMGRDLAKERTERIRKMRDWWYDETEGTVSLPEDAIPTKPTLPT